MASIVYTGAQYATPSASFAYDPKYDRLLSMTDWTGTTQYTCKPVTSPAGTLGANQIDTIFGPSSLYSVAYTYDELERPLSKKVDGVGNTVSYDALGRLATASNPLGSFTYHYVNQTPRLDSVDRPGGQSVVYRYYGNSGDERLSEIKNLGPAALLMSKFNYTYNPVGDIPRVDAADRGGQRAILRAGLRRGGPAPSRRSQGYRHQNAGHALHLPLRCGGQSHERTSGL